METEARLRNAVVLQRTLMMAVAIDLVVKIAEGMENMPSAMSDRLRVGIRRGENSEHFRMLDGTRAATALVINCTLVVCDEVRDARDAWLFLTHEGTASADIHRGECDHILEGPTDEVVSALAAKLVGHFKK